MSPEDLGRFMFERNARDYGAEADAIDYWWNEDAVHSFWLAEAEAVLGFLGRLDGTEATAVSLMTNLSPEDLEELGGMPE